MAKESTTEIENQQSTIFKLEKKVCSYTILIDAFNILLIDHSYAEHTEGCNKRFGGRH